MDILKEFYIYGRPIETRIGKLHFITVGEYYDFILEGHFSHLTLDKRDLIKRINEMVNNSSDVKPITDAIGNITLFDFVMIMGSKEIKTESEDSYIKLLKLDKLYDGFRELFKFCFKEDVFFKISTSEEFEFYRDLIVEINCIPYEKPNPNPEIERYNQMKRLMQKNKGESINFESMYTSVGLAIGKDPDDMTLYKFNKYFNRLAQFKNYDTSTLFATVSKDAKIEPWYKVIEDKEETQQTISEEELRNKTQRNL